MSSIPLRRRLLTLVAAAILPVAAVSGLALYVFTEKQREPSPPVHVSEFKGSRGDRRG